MYDCTKKGANPSIWIYTFGYTIKYYFISLFVRLQAPKRILGKIALCKLHDFCRL